MRKLFPSEWAKLEACHQSSPLLPRIRAARLLVEETKQGYATIAKETGVEPRTLAYWAQQIALGRLSSVIRPQQGRRGGRHAKLTQAVQNTLRTMLWADPKKPAGDIRRWLERRHGVVLSPQSVNYWIVKLAGEKRAKLRRRAKPVLSESPIAAP